MPLTHGVPSADTFRRVLGAIDPRKFAECFGAWIQSLSGRLDGQVIAVDGKTLRGSYDDAATTSPPHLVHAWAAGQQLLLGQLATAEKSNETTAISALLQTLALQGAVVTIDAMGCHKAIADTIVEQQADYVLALKGNQETLHQEVADSLDDAIAHPEPEVPLSYSETTEEAHGRTRGQTGVVLPSGPLGLGTNALAQAVQRGRRRAEPHGWRQNHHRAAVRYQQPAGH